MTTLGEFSEAYHQHYYKGKGVEVGKKIGLGLNDQKKHDFWHVLASGVFNSSGKTPEEKFVEFEYYGHIDRIIGAKAEGIQKIYRFVFEDLVNNRDIKKNDKLSEDWLCDDYCFPILGAMLKRIDNVDKENKEDGTNKLYSDVPAVHELFKQYKQLDLQRKVGGFIRINSEELNGYIDDAIKLYNLINEKHPECFVDCKINYDELMAIDSDELKTEKTAIINAEPQILAHLKSVEKTSKTGKSL